MGAEDLFKLVDHYSSPAMTKAIGLIVILYFAALGLLRLVDTWRSFRTRRAILEEEKLFNEILKIRYEIEVLRKQYALPQFASQLVAQPQGGVQAQIGVQATGAAAAQGGTQVPRQVPAQGGAPAQAEAQALSKAQTPVEVQAEEAAPVPPVESAHQRYSFALPAVPTFSPIAALFSLPFNRPPKGWQRARWALKWILYLILLFVAFVAVTVSVAAESDTGAFLLGFVALGVTALCAYFALTASYNGVLAAVAARDAARVKRAAAAAS